MSNETDLDWLARDRDEWHFFSDAIASVSDGVVRWLDPNIYSKSDGITKDQWLARRAELQNKPSFSDHPDAKCLFQHESGRWFKNIESSDMGVDGISWLNNQLSRGVDYGWVVICQGEVLGDWRDTLERRPEEFKPSIEEANRLAQEFKPFISIEDNQEREMKQDNGWFERGELPPAGTKCEFCNSDDEWVDWHHCIFVGKDAHGAGVISIIGDDAGMLYRSGNPKDFRPIRTEREVAIEEMMKTINAIDFVGTPHHLISEISEVMYDAGYRKEQK